MIPHDEVALIGAAGRSGVALARALRADGVAVRPVVRNAEKWASSGLPETPHLADLRDASALQAALAGARCVVSCAHARHAGAIIAAADPEARFVFLGSTRKFSHWLDEHGRGVLAGEAALLRSGRAGMMLHPTMIYGAQGEDNVQRLARLLRRLPLVPLPGGGRALVQPIHQSDVTRAVMAALRLPPSGPRSLVIAGPAPLPYADFVRAIATAARLRPPRIVAVPASVLRVGAWGARAVPGLPKVRSAEIRRLLEDKAFDIAPMRDVLGIDPIGLDQGLAGMFP